MAHISGKNGGVYTSALLVEDCEDAWNEHTESGCTPSTTTGKVGTYCARVTTVGVGADKLLMSEVISKDLSSYDAVVWYARSSLTTTATQLKLLLDDTGECASAVESLVVPALTADTWKYCFDLLAAPASCSALISIGLYQDEDLDDGTFDIDDVKALAEVDGIKSWTIDYVADALEVTDFVDAGVRDYVAGCTGWTGTFEGYKDGAPLAIGSEVILALGESSTNGQYFLGDAIITGVHANVAFDGVVTYSYDFTGAGALEMPWA